MQYIYSMIPIRVMNIATAIYEAVETFQQLTKVTDDEIIDSLTLIRNYYHEYEQAERVQGDAPERDMGEI